MFIIVSKLFTGKKPPEDIIVKDKLSESKDLTSKIFKSKKINNFKKLYKTIIFKDCFSVSLVLNDSRFVKGFFKFTSKISIKSTIENKKYRPPNHCEEDRHKIMLGSRCLIFSNIVNPVEVKPDTDSK